jgi:hypothetical protein
LRPHLDWSGWRVARAPRAPSLRPLRERWKACRQRRGATPF